MENAVPQHVAIIMDGNGRWAQKRGLPISLGHREGAKRLVRTLIYCKKNGIKHLTVYAFSTENWKRSKEEVGYIMGLVRIYLKRVSKRFEKENINVKFIGCLKMLDKDLQEGIKEIEKNTKDNTGLFFNIAFSYGGRREIVDACKKFTTALENKEITKDELNEQTFRRFLYDSTMTDPDLIIRTGGDKRLSNFLLWELSYSELYFVNTLWPDFDDSCFDIAVEDFKHRKRTFGERKAKR